MDLSILLTAMLCGVVWCNDGGAAQSIRVKPGVPPFVLPSGAQNPRVIQQGEGAIQYELKEAYPATTSLAEIQKALQAAAWSPLSEDLWNPGVPSSNKDGWTNFVDGRESPKVRLYQWLGYWRNSAGDVVVYGIHYRARDAEFGSLPLGSGSVNVVFISAAALARARVRVPPQ